MNRRIIVGKKQIMIKGGISVAEAEKIQELGDGNLNIDLRHDNCYITGKQNLASLALDIGEEIKTPVITNCKSAGKQMAACFAIPIAVTAIL